MRIYLVRHAQSEWQLHETVSLDADLTPLGHRQAMCMAKWLAEDGRLDHCTRIQIAGLCASPYLRAQNTASYSSTALDLPVCTLPALREADFHVADYLSTADGPLKAHHPYEIPARYMVFKHEVSAGLVQLVEAAETARGHILAITHGGFIKTLLRLILSTDTVCFHLYNTGLTAIEWERGRWHLAYLNLLDHLPVGLRTI